jgi:hypothetical protein
LARKKYRLEQIEKQKFQNVKVYNLTPLEEEKIDSKYDEFKKLQIAKYPKSDFAIEDKVSKERKRIPNLFGTQLRDFVKS